MSFDVGLLKRAFSRAMKVRITDRAAGLAYYGFLAVPSVMLLALGVVGIVMSPDDVRSVLDKGADVMPPEAITLLNDSIGRQAGKAGGSSALIGLGFLLAMWSGSGAMGALIRSLGDVYEVTETRSFARQRLTALAMLGWVLLALVLVVGLLILGPALSGWLGDTTGHPGLTSALWWTLEWPLLVGGLLVAFAGLLRLGPDRETRWRIGTAGAAVATVLWLVVSAGFAFYASRLGAFNAAWGSLSVVVVTLMWLWLSATVLLFGAAIDAEQEASRG